MCPQLDMDLLKSGKQTCQRSVRMKGMENWDNFWDSVLTDSSKCCYILELSRVDTAGQFGCRLDLPSNVTKAVQISISESSRVDCALEINLKQSSVFGLRITCDFGRGGDLSIDLNSTQSGENSEFMYYGRFACGENSTMDIVTSGFLGELAIGSSCSYDSKVLQLGQNTKISGRPEMEILNDKCNASHGFSAERIPEDAKLYLKSRGLGDNEVEKVYSRGFLGRI